MAWRKDLVERILKVRDTLPEWLKAERFDNRRSRYEFYDCPLISAEWDGGDTLLTFRVPQSIPARAGTWTLLSDWEPEERVEGRPQPARLVPVGGEA